MQGLFCFSDQSLDRLSGLKSNLLSLIQFDFCIGLSVQKYWLRPYLSILLAAQIALPLQVLARPGQSAAEPMPAQAQLFPHVLKRDLPFDLQTGLALGGLTFDARRPEPYSDGRKIQRTLFQNFMESLDPNSNLKTPESKLKIVTETKHILSTVFLLSFLSSMERVKAKHDYGKYAVLTEDEKKRGLTSPEIKSTAQIVEDVSVGMVNDLGFWMAVAGNSFIGKAITQKAWFQTVLASMTSVLGRGMWAYAARNFVTTAITFLGWEFGGELFTQARYVLSADADAELPNSVYQQSQKLLPILAKIVIDPLAQNAESLAARKTLDRIIGSILFVITEPEARDAWIYSTWRKRITSGNFLSLISCLTAASVAAAVARLGPAGQSLAGIVGILVHTFAIPQSWKDRASHEAQDAREDLSVGHRFFAFDQLKQSIRTFHLMARADETEKTNLRKIVFEKLNDMSRFRDDGMFVYFEKLHKMFSEAAFAYQKAKADFKLGDKQAGAAGEAFAKQIYVEINAKLNAISEWHQQDAERLLKLQSSDPQIVDAIQIHFWRLWVLRQHLDDLAKRMKLYSSYTDQPEVAELYLRLFMQGDREIPQLRTLLPIILQWKKTPDSGAPADFRLSNQDIPL